ncbi:MAG: ATP-dependent helicase/deoxyribonuclease subunit B [Tenericutes bacterium ADurb.Bin239]|nr:MAG: ATP-dependent helicase/deoxyribonuclease subunit B [Tenericutes bacterium ADurb.Bin239]
MNNLITLLSKSDYVIVDYATKLELLKLRIQNPTLSFKILTVDEVICKFLGGANDQSLFALIAKYDGLSYKHAQTINNTIVFPSEGKSNKKLKTLTAYRNALKDLNLLAADPLVTYSLKNKTILLPKYLENNYLLINLLNQVQTNLIFLDNVHNYTHSVTIFPTGIDEVYDVLNQISGLLAHGVPSHNIKIIRPTNNYEKLLRKLAPQFNIVLGPELFPLSAFTDVNIFVNQFRGQRIETSDVFTQLIGLNNTPSLIALYNLIQNIDFDAVDNKYHYEILSDKVKREFIALDTNNGIEFIEEIPLVSNNSMHYFYLNFAHGSAPAIKSLSPYLNNVERKELGLLDDETTALIDENRLITTLLNNKNIHISFATILGQENYELSNIVNRLEYNTIEHDLESDIYSQQYLNYLYGRAADKYIRYNIDDRHFGSLMMSNDKHPYYNSFNFEFKGLEYVHDTIYLSPTKIQLYQSVPFDYFACYLLHIKDERPSIHKDYGSFVHSVLEHSKDEQTFIASFNHYLDHYNFSSKDRFFVENDYELIAEAFRFNKRYLEVVKPTNIHSEIAIKVQFADKCVLNGRLDRILLFENGDKKYAFVVDFKTGTASSRPRYYAEGLELQLPIYGLLLSLDCEYKEYDVAALLLNSIQLGSSYAAGSPETFKEAINENLYFTGILVNEPERLSVINANADGPETFFKIGGRTKIKTLVDLTNLEDYNRYIKLAHDKVAETFNGIRANDFAVRQKFIGGNSSAKYSPYKQLSFIAQYTTSNEDDYDE